MTTPESSGPGNSPDAPQEVTTYTLFCVLRRDHTSPPDLQTQAISAVGQAIDDLAVAGVSTRGLYDVSGMRADADLMIWLHGPSAQGLQAAYRRLRRTAIIGALVPTWNAMGVHRTAEFNARHVPAFMRGLEAKGWLCLYPFVRSHEWYLLDDAERSTMLADHGRRGAAHRGVLANTVAAFALGDYEWLLPLEADDPLELVDLMRDLRYTEARRHVREEVPFYTGRRIQPDELAEVLR